MLPVEPDLTGHLLPEADPIDVVRWGRVVEEALEYLAVRIHPGQIEVRRCDEDVVDGHAAVRIFSSLIIRL